MPPDEYAPEETITPANLRDYRLASGMTQDQLGNLIGCDKFTVCRIETGRREITHAEQLVLAAYLLGAPLPQPPPSPSTATKEARNEQKR